MPIINIQILTKSRYARPIIYDLYDPKVVNVGDQSTSEIYINTQKISLLGRPRFRQWMASGAEFCFYGFEVILDGQQLIFGSKFAVYNISALRNVPADNSNFEILQSIDKTLVNQLYEQLEIFFKSKNLNEE